jgi:hypothetical protein
MGRVTTGPLGARAAATHWASADGQVTHPFLLQMSIEPSLLTDHPQRAPLAVLSMHMPTAVLPFVAEAGVESVTAVTPTIARNAIAAARLGF